MRFIFDYRMLSAIAGALCLLTLEGCSSMYYNGHEPTSSTGPVSPAASGQAEHDDYPAWTKAAGWLMLPFTGPSGSVQF